MSGHCKAAIIMGDHAGLIQDSLGEKKITRQQALAIADSEASKVGYSIKEKRIGITERSVSVDSLVLIREVISGDTILSPSLFKHIVDKMYRQTDVNRKKFSGRKFWVVAFLPIVPIGSIPVGGDFWIFIDASTGKVLQEVRGK